MPRSAILSRSLFSALLVVGVPDIITAQQPAGVFTLEQAQSGHALYNRNCAACHGIDLEGSGDAVWSKYSNVLKPWVMSPRAERLWENVTRQIWTA